MSILTQHKSQQAAYLIKLVAWAGNQTVLANELGVSRQVVHGWLTRGRISATMAIKVEEITCGKFTKEQLRPDVKTWDEK